MASLSAVQTAVASISGGSPTALERKIVASRDGRVVEHPHVEDRRHVAAAGDLVGRGPDRAQPALLVPPQLLAGEPALALHEGALDLAEIDRGIERGAAILHQVGAQHAALAGQGVDRHFGRRRAEGEIEERPAAHRRAIPVDLRRLVEAGRGQRHAAQIAELAPARRSSRPGCCPAWRCARCRRRTRSRPARRRNARRRRRSCAA